MAEQKAIIKKEVDFLKEIVSLLKKESKEYTISILEGLKKCKYKIYGEGRKVGLLFFAFNEDEYDDMWISFSAEKQCKKGSLYYNSCRHGMNNLYIKNSNVHINRKAKGKMIEGEDMKKLIEDKKVVFDEIGWNENQKETVYSLTVEEVNKLHEMLTQ